LTAANLKRPGRAVKIPRSLAMNNFSGKPQFLGKRPLDATDATRFTREELIAAMRLITNDAQEAVAMVRALTEAPDGTPLAASQFTTDTLTLISLISEDAAKRVQELLGETSDDATHRMQAMRRTLGLSG
jgi:hypothetical protein